MAKGRKNQILIYVLVGVLVLGLLYLYFHRNVEGFQQLLDNKSTDSTKLIYETTAIDGNSKDSRSVKIKGSDLVGKTIKDYYIEYKACDTDKWYRLAACGSGTIRSGKSNISLGETTKNVTYDIGPNQPAGKFTSILVKFEGDKTGKTLRSSFFKNSGSSGKLIMDCPPFITGDTSNTKSVSLPDTMPPATNSILVPYNTSTDSLITNEKGLIFENVRDVSIYGGKISCTTSTKGNLNFNANPNIRITILV